VPKPHFLCDVRHTEALVPARILIALSNGSLAASKREAADAIKQWRFPMTHLPMMRDLQPLTKLNARRETAAEAAWRRIVAAVTSPDLVAVATFCAIGLAITINVLLHHPALGLTIEQLGLFP
jgi:hypothetical protein